MQEAERYGISKLEYFMRRYVVEFGKGKSEVREARSN